MHPTRHRARERVRWTFEGRVFDEASWQLLVAGAPVEIENKPLQILLELLNKAGEVVTRQELLDLVWPGVKVVEGSLSTAISKLRKALDDPRGSIIATVPRLGYRLAVPVARQVTLADTPDLELGPGDRVPGRSQWVLERQLRRSADRETWAAVYEKTGERRVFKLTTDSTALRALKREVAVSRLLRSALGDRPDFAAVLEWNFEAPPFFTEAPWIGPALPEWSDMQGGLDAMPIERRIAFMAAVCETVAAAHGVGTIHRDLKPSNILVREGDPPQPCIVDFGSAGLIDPSIARQFDVTWSGQPGDGRGSDGSSLLWLAPEVARGEAATTASDVFSLGVLLYQMIVGDLIRPLAPGWEADIADPLLREDIAAAANGAPERRLSSAGELAHRLHSLETRRTEAARIAATAVEAAELAERLKRVRARRPWVITALTTLALGVIVSTSLYARAARDRDEAERQSLIAEQVAEFLGTDLLARTSPFIANAADERLIDAAKRVAPQIDRRFAHEPMVAAQLHQKIGAALNQRGDFDGSRSAYAQAVQHWTAALGPDAPQTRIARAQQASMEVRSQQPQSLARGEAILADLDRSTARLPANDKETVWIEALRGTIAFVKGDMATSRSAHERSLAAAEHVPDLDPNFGLAMRNRLFMIRFRAGDAAGAERGYQQLARDWAAVEGPDGPQALVALSFRAEALHVLGRQEEALAEANRLLPLMRRTLGADQQWTLSLEAARVRFLTMLERYADAERFGVPAYASLVRVLGAENAVAIDLLATLALVRCRDGRLAAGTADAARARADAAELGDPALQGGTDYVAAECALAGRRYDQAEALLAGIDRAAVSASNAEPRWGGNVELGLARVALARGDRAGAAHHLRAAAPTFASAPVDPRQARLWRELSRTTG